ncbi:MAG TPA: hypothetical protein VFI73_14795 [Candidatus Nitrosopolaris sp.]|nr:hypothetical protein [Candidatus Nitrosopolaris sp.]
MEEFLFPIFRFDSTCHPELIETAKPFYKKVMTLGEKIGTGTHIKLYQFDSSIIEITIRTQKISNKHQVFIWRVKWYADWDLLYIFNN